tara:strand:+ start:1711 stop:2142 length:432 start_codon:yes stop_codon:yes gene_type:complete
MNKILPDEHIRTAIYNAIDGIVVDGKTVNCYDTNVTGGTIPNQYVIMSTQSNEVDKANKCEYFWDSDILLDIVTIYQNTGNTGSRLLADRIANKVRELTNVLTLGTSGLTVIYQKQSFPNDLSLQTENQNVFRKFIRISLKIK